MPAGRPSLVPRPTLTPARSTDTRTLSDPCEYRSVYETKVKHHRYNYRACVCVCGLQVQFISYLNNIGCGRLGGESAPSSAGPSVTSATRSCSQKGVCVVCECACKVDCSFIPLEFDVGRGRPGGESASSSAEPSVTSATWSCSQKGVCVVCECACKVATCSLARETTVRPAEADASPEFVPSG